MEIEEQRRQLSHLARVAVLGQLSGALAHELRQPLSSILANAEAARHLIERKVIDVEELRAIVHDIILDDRRAAHVIDGLRAMLKRGETCLQPIAPLELVRETLELAHAELIARRVTVTAVVEPDLPLVHADRVQIQQVLLNLVLNASESMAGTAVSDRVLVLGASNADSNVCFSVRDSGAGIHGDLIERLFEPFVSTKPEGLGLGLSIARSIIAAHGGRIWAANGDVSGATVQFLLPSLPGGDEAVVAPVGGYAKPSRVEQVLS
jgi:two-component system sensor kinase FixL